MTWIDGLGATHAVAARPLPPRRAGGAGFALPAAQAPSAAAVPQSGVVGLGMLAVQEQAAGAVADREARRHGQAVLRALAALQHALLAARMDPDTLGRLADLVASTPQASDPGLRQIVQAITLRARVEIARMEAQGRQGPA